MGGLMWNRYVEYVCARILIWKREKVAAFFRGPSRVDYSKN